LTRLNLLVGIILVSTALCVSGSCLEDPYISINHVSDHEAGETFAINGTTSLAAGKTLVFDIEPVRLHPFPSQEPPQNITSLTGRTITEHNPGGRTTWSFIVNSASLVPDYYTLRVTSFDSPIIDGSDDFTLTPPGNDQPGTSTAPTRVSPDPTGAPIIYGALIVLVITGVCGVYVLRKRRNNS
jgi:hypothetical protein